MSHGLTACVSEICDSACISDHLPVLLSATIPCTVVAACPPSCHRRVISTSTHAQFSALFKDSVLSSADGSRSVCAEELTTLFNSTCSNILNSIAPLRISRPKAHHEPWITDSVRALRRSCRCAERRWKKDRLQVSFEILWDCLLEYQRAANVAKSSYISNPVSTNIRKPNVLFSVLNSIVTPQDAACVVPTSTLCNDFLSFFTDKITALRSVPVSTDPDPCVPPLCQAAFNQFEPVSLSELSEVVHDLKPTSCSLDSIPSKFLKGLFDSVESVLLVLVNACLSSGSFPSAFKHAVVQPLLKKPNLDPSLLSNFRPISKLPFLSKVLEKVVFKQLQSFLIENSVYEKFQSGFRARHSIAQHSFNC
ncbi:uncharacterized protein LOC121613344 [Chelmon rostratus]|uniref:uncharacterized protein LOC121613344 n=1 Tax=Chelmon rostratus TaxID=109905 RepID=UPI001BE6D44C|nr:uncharacterized protein LOC121613344 [Chelmon rostratus]